MRVLGIIMVILGGASYLLPFCRAALPFRIPLMPSQAFGLALVLLFAGLIAVLAGREA
jgi:hypothetical protein